MKKILILYTSVGLGHKSLGLNIAAVLEAAGHDVETLDILAVEKGKWSAVGEKLHRGIHRYVPWLWGFLYQSSVVNFLALPLRLWVAARNSVRTLRAIREFGPDMVICTQTSASAVVAYLKKEKLYQGFFGIAFSDYHFHPFWHYEQADFYLVNIDEQVSRLVELGVKKENIFVCGMTLQAQPEVYDRITARKKLGILPEEKVVLVSSGSLGSGLETVWLDALAARDWKIFVVCGKNETLRARLAARYPQSRVKVLGFYQPMQELYAAADIFVTKPGGLTTAEALSFNLPMVVNHILPGQEKLNLEYLDNRKLVIDATSGEVEKVVEAELATGAFAQSLKSNIYRREIVSFGKPVQDAVGKVFGRR